MPGRYHFRPYIFQFISHSTSRHSTRIATEQVSLQVPLDASIRELLGSNFDPDIGYPDSCAFRRFSQFLQANNGVVVLLIVNILGD
jgi:hypothetical protein